MAEPFDETALIRAMNENRFADALQMVLRKADAHSIATTSPLAPGSPSAAQAQAEADAATMSHSAAEGARMLLAACERKRGAPLDENEIAALIMAGRALGIAEAFAASVELRWPEIVERHTIIMQNVLEESFRGTSKAAH